MGPKIFAYVDKKGRPMVVIILQLLFGCLAFLNLDKSGGGTIFDWLLALSGLSSFFIYGSIAIAHIRFRSAWYDTLRSLRRCSIPDCVFTGNFTATASKNSPSKPHLESGALTSVPS